MSFAPINAAVNKVMISKIQELKAFITKKSEEDEEAFDMDVVIDEFIGLMTEKKKGKKDKDSDTDKPEKKTRAASVYNLFIKHWMKKLETENPEMAGKDRMKEASTVWKEGSDEFVILVKEQTEKMKGEGMKDSTEIFAKILEMSKFPEEEEKPKEEEKKPKAKKEKKPKVAKVESDEE
jgi:hypothetical protein